MSADLVNLRRARKAKRRAEAAGTAAENRARFGLTRTERAGERADRDRVSRHLDGHRREPSGEADGEPG